MKYECEKCKKEPLGPILIRFGLGFLYCETCRCQLEEFVEYPEYLLDNAIK